MKDRSEVPLEGAPEFSDAVSMPHPIERRRRKDIERHIRKGLRKDSLEIALSDGFDLQLHRAQMRTVIGQRSAATNLIESLLKSRRDR